MIVSGFCNSEFSEIKDIFKKYFDEGKETGANFSIVKNGQIFVNIFGGKKNEKDNWNEDTIVNTFSLSKGIYASCVAKLIEEKKIDINKKVSYYWPEFKKNKDNVKVKDILSHQSGIYRFKQLVTNKDLLDFNKIIRIIEEQSLDHETGKRTFYHAKTHGYLIENLLKKITGSNLKIYFKENFSNPLNINFHFGCDQTNFDNIADLDETKVNEHNEEKNIEFNAFNNPQHDINFYNSKEWRLAGIPSMGGHGSALAVAKLYDILANDLRINNKKIISQNTFSKILETSNSNIDESLNVPIKWTYSGFILRGGWMFGKNKSSFGHNGWGGSLGFGDPVEGLGISYVTKKINSGMQADFRAVHLIKKTYEILERNLKNYA